MLFAQKKEKNISMTATETATDATDIHYTGKYCTECHVKIPQKKGDALLKFGGDFSQLCRCHGYTPGTYIHPVDVEPSEEKKAKIPVREMPLQNGKITCLTCHDMYMQCEYNPRLKQLNKLFLRGAPFAHRTDICFKCHDEKKYKMLDPHNQFDADHNIVVEKCLYCHVEKPNVEFSTFEDVELVGNLEVLCQRCHGERDHPSGKNHLRVPSANTLRIMREGERLFNIVLPLDDNGKVSCPTCHNPHEKGVIPAERAGAKGASEKFRHRLPGNICMACHQK
jgi:hypothetical protein